MITDSVLNEKDYVLEEWVALDCHSYEVVKSKEALFFLNLFKNRKHQNVVHD
jgi:hypothetical protein